MRQIMFSRLSSIAATSARNDSSNIDCAAQVVPEAVHRGFFDHGLGEQCAETGFQFLRCLRGGDDAVVAGDAACLVVAHAVGDEIDLVAEVVVQDAVGELRILGDFAQARACVAQFGQGLQCGLGELITSLGEFVRPGDATPCLRWTAWRSRTASRSRTAGPVS